MRSADTEDDPLEVHQADLLDAHQAELVAQIASGNIEEPMRELYQRYAGSIYRLGVQMLGNPGLAEEVVQQSFERLWRSAGRFDAGRGTVGAYLTVIARSIAHDIAKRPSSRRLLPLDDLRALDITADGTDYQTLTGTATLAYDPQLRR